MKLSITRCAVFLCYFAIGIQRLDAQTTWVLQAGTGPGSVSLTVDQWGHFPSYSYHAFGSPTPTITGLGETDLYFRVGPTGGRAILAGGTPSVMTGVPLTSCSNTFTLSGINFKLDQSVAPYMMMPGPMQNGVILTQTYTMTNTTAAAIDIDFVKYMHEHFSGTDIAGGRKAGPPETFLYYDSNKPTNTCVMEWSFTGGLPLVADRYNYDDWLVAISPSSGTPLPNLVTGDGDGDGLIDPANEPGSHSTMAVRNAFTIAAGATATYTVTLNLIGNSVPVPTGLKITGNPTVKEAGATGSYTLELLSAPTANVTITLNPDSQVSVLPKTLTFTTLNWNVPQTVTVTAVDDPNIEGKHVGRITHAGTSTDVTYSSANLGTLTVNIIDDDSLNKFEGNFPFSQKPPTIVNVGEGTMGYGRNRAVNNESKSPILSQSTTGGPNGRRIFNVAYMQAASSIETSSTGTGTALAIGSSLILAAGLALAARKSAFTD